MFDSVLQDIESVFASPSWRTTNIEIYPVNYQGAILNENEYCRLSVLPSNSLNYAYDAKKLLSGLIAIKIFVSAGEGDSRIMQISDTLDTFLQNKKLDNGTELNTSYINVEGLDPSNKALYSASYIIPFKLYGE